MKENPITIGVDDAQFELHTSARKTQLIAVVCQGIRIVHIDRKEIEIDGEDATNALIDLVKRNEKHAQYVLTHTITFGGFNIVNLERIYKETEKPIIAVTEREPNLETVNSALKAKFFDSYEKKLANIVSAGNLFETELETSAGLSKVYYHCKGISVSEVEELLKKITIDSKLPECVRIAHLVGKLF